MKSFELPNFPFLLFFFLFSFGPNPQDLLFPCFLPSLVGLIASGSTKPFWSITSFLFVLPSFCSCCCRAELGHKLNQWWRRSSYGISRYRLPARQVSQVGKARLVLSVEVTLTSAKVREGDECSCSVVEGGGQCSFQEILWSPDQSLAVDDRSDGADGSWLDKSGRYALLSSTGGSGKTWIHQ